MMLSMIARQDSLSGMAACPHDQFHGVPRHQLRWLDSLVCGFLRTLSRMMMGTVSQ
jgi:hypothetical protein